MLTSFPNVARASICALALLTGSVTLADTSIDFEDFVIGTDISNQYAGVTFSCVPGSCGGGMPRPNIVVPDGGTSSPTRGLTVPNGCGGFNTDFLRMVFAANQEHVSFTLGDEGALQYQVRAYTAGNVLFNTQNIQIIGEGPGGTGDAGVFRVVNVHAAGANKIRRIEIEETSDGVTETIDDLFFTRCDGDDTPPIAEIDSRDFNACVCGSVSFTGRACDPDGNYDHDTLEYMRVNPPGPWTTIGTETIPQCTAGGALYTWNTAPAAITEGYYILRMTVTNACGLTSQAITVVYVDKSFSGLSIASPANAAIVGRQVCVVGSVSDYCLNTWSVAYQPAGGGAFVAIAAGNSALLNNTFAVWDTVAAGVPDGNYNIRIQANDICGNAQTIVRLVTVDNTPPSGPSCGCAGPSPDTDGDGDVDVDDLVNVILNWGPFP